MGANRNREPRPLGYRTVLTIKIFGILALAALTTTGCRNDAITYAHALNEHASCVSLSISQVSSRPDQAICVLPNGDRWTCLGQVADTLPSCQRITAPPTCVTTPVERVELQGTP